MEDRPDKMSISMGPIATSEIDPNPQHQPAFFRGQHVLGNLSLSSIKSDDNSHTVHLYSVSSPTERGPDILSSTMNVKPVDLPDDEISMGPLPNYTQIMRRARESLKKEAIPRIPKTENEKIPKVTTVKHKDKKNVLKLPKAAENVHVSASTQTNEYKCRKCEEFIVIVYNYERKLSKIQSAFQQQCSTLNDLVDQLNKADDEAQKKIRDLMEQLEGADKQLKADRAFLEQQTIEREQEREEALEQQRVLRNALLEKEKENDHQRDLTAQLSAEVEHLQAMLKEKEELIEKGILAQQQMEQKNKSLQLDKEEIEEELLNLQEMMPIKDKLLKAQAEQIDALHMELEKQLHIAQHSDPEEEAVSRHPQDMIQSESENLVLRHDVEVSSLFEELQHLVVHLLHKVDHSIQILEAAQLSKQHGTTLLSPRSLTTPSTSTEDVSLKDRITQESLDNMGDGNSSPAPLPSGPVHPAATLNFLQQLAGRLATLNRIEEVTCKRIADLEGQLQRVEHAHKQTSNKAATLEQQYNQQCQLMLDIEAEKQVLQSERIYFLKRISCLENRLEEQRRSAALGAVQSVNQEKWRQLLEEKQELQRMVQQKDDSIERFQLQITQLQHRISKLTKLLHEKEAEIKGKEEHLSIEKQRDAPPQDSSMNWSKFQGNGSPLGQSTASHPPQQLIKQVSNALESELENCKSNLQKFQQQCQNLETEIGEKMSKIQQLESIEQHYKTLEVELQAQKEIEGKYIQLQQRCQELEDALALCKEKHQNAETIQRRCSVLEIELGDYKKAAEELKQSRQYCAAIQRDLISKKETIQKLETANNLLLADKEILIKDREAALERCSALEAELAKVRQSLEELIRLKERSAAFEDEVFTNSRITDELNALHQKCVSLEAALKVKSVAYDELLQKLQSSNNCKAQVEHALQRLQREVEFLKQVHHRLPSSEQQHKAGLQRESTPVEAGPAAPPDLLAPSFVEFLGSMTNSRSSSRSPSIKGRSPSSTLRTTESTLDFSLPNSLTGKETLKKMQQESEELLAFTKKLLEEKQQQNEEQQKRSSQPPVNEVNTEDDPEATLKPEDQITKSSFETELRKKIEMLETQLVLERLLLNDQREANALQQQQIIDLLSQQRLLQSVTQHATDANSNAGWSKNQNYHCLKLESIRKNLIYQKKFLTGIVNEFEQQRSQQTVSRPCRPKMRFRVAALAVISIFRMRFILRQWRRRRRTMEGR